MLLSTILPFGILATSVAAKKAATTGKYTLTVDGTTYNPTAGDSAKGSNIVPKTSIVKVRGTHSGFDVDFKTLGVVDYMLTGAPDTERMVNTPTILFTSKVAQLTAAQLSGASIKSFELRDDTLVIIFNTAAGKLKLQAKDGAAGGIFQMETEFAGNVTFTHTLGPKLFYFLNSVTGKINFGDGIDKVTQVQSATLYHNMLLGKDSPQVATKTYQDGSTTKWNVAPGGRLGGVLGEDATELGAGASNCTSQCQAQNQIKGSIPPQQDPEDPVPIGGPK